MNIDSRKGFSMTTMSILNPAYRRDNLAPFYVLDDIFTMRNWTASWLIAKRPALKTPLRLARETGVPGAGAEVPLSAQLQMR